MAWSPTTVRVAREYELVARGSISSALEAAEAEYPAEYRPAVGYVTHDDSGAGFASIPVQVNKGAVAGGEVVVSVENGGEDDEDAERKDATEYEFSDASHCQWLDGIENVGMEEHTFSAAVVP